MVRKLLAKLRHAVGEIRDFLDEKAVRSANSAPLSRLQHVAHFWLMVARNFSTNRCPMQATALAYSSLLALIPMLFVALSISGSILKEEGNERLNHFIDKLLINMTPPTPAGTNAVSTGVAFGTNSQVAATEPAANAPFASISETNAAPVKPAKPLADREQIINSINGFVRNTQSARLGVTGVMALICIAILMLSSIESSLNHIWSVTRGRKWLARILQYWAVISLGPALLAVALALAGGLHLPSPGQLMQSMPFLSEVLRQLAPVVVLCLAFSLFYFLIPNTRVHWDAALAGGLVGGVLWHLNNYFSVLYVSRWITNSKIYGSLAVIPVFMAGLYFSWLILLFGAQVAHAYQYRAAYLQEKRAENINQRGREFVALRLMEFIGQRFQAGLAPAMAPELAERLAVPERLVRQIAQTLLAARLVVEVSGLEPAYAPARPLENINCHDILLALRAGQGEELATRDDPARAGVFGEYERILAAEKSAASSVTVLALVSRAEPSPALSGGPWKAVTDAKPV